MNGSKYVFLHTALAAILVIGAVAQVDAGSSEEVNRHMARGNAAMQMAESPRDYQDAVQEFSEAVKLAPDLADAWFNLGVAQEAAGQYQAAINSFKTYLEKRPEASDRDAVETRLFGLEYKAAKASKPAKHLSGEWIGQQEGIYRPRGPGSERVHGKDRFKFRGSGRHIDVLLDSAQQGYNTSFFGDYSTPPTGRVVFSLDLDGADISGFYVQPAFGRCNAGRRIPVSGKTNGDRNTMTLHFDDLISTDRYANDGSLLGCTKASPVPVTLTMKRTK